MAVTSTLPITFTDLYNEFGGDPNSITLSDYLRGAGLVPNIPENSGVPTSLPVSLDDFLGSQKVIPSVNYTGSSTYNAAEPNSVSISVIVTNDGYVDWEYTIVSGGGGSTVNGNYGTWTDSAPLMNGGDYEAYVRLLGWQGATPTGALNTWVSLDSDLIITQDDTPDNGFGVEIEVRSKSTPADNDIFSITMRSVI